MISRAAAGRFLAALPLSASLVVSLSLLPLGAGGFPSAQAASPARAQAVSPTEASALPRLAATVSPPTLRGKKRFADAAGREEQQAIVREVAAGADFTERLIDASQRFLAAPYILDALGEGQNAPDADPLLRLDAADCMTLVETAMALADASTLEEAEKRLTDIRYDRGQVGFDHRHHFFSAQWVPAQAAAGRLADITEEVGQVPQMGGNVSLAVRHTKTVTEQQWQARTAGRHFRLPRERQPVGTVSFSYIPLNKVLNIASRLPDGALFALVREDRPLTPFMVTHVGFVVRHSDKVWLRHAGRDLYGQVIDEELPHFVQRAARYKKWPVLGMRFFRAQKPIQKLNSEIR